MEREHANDRIERLLDAVVAASTYTIRDTRLTFEQVRQLAPFDRSMRRRIRVEVPQPETADLAEALGRVLDRFTDPDTGRIGFAPHDLIGGPVTGMTIDLLATGIVTAAAILGTDRVVSAVLSWAEGKPGSYVYTWVLRGVDVPKRVELREGIRFEKLPEGSADLLEHIEDWSHVGVDELAGQPVLRYDFSVDPMFYRLKSDDDADKIRSTAVKGPQPPDLNLRYLLDALSLVCRSNVQCVYEWNEYSEEMLLLTGGSTGLFTHNVHRFHSRASDWTTLTQERLEEVETVMGQLDGRDDLEMAVARWKNSSVALDAANRIIDLRTVLECLYTKGERQELGFRAALCGAWHLAPTTGERPVYYRKLRDLYQTASRAVHGGKLGVVDGDLVKWSHETCRRAILKRLEEPSELDWTALMLGLPQPSDRDPCP